MICRNIASFSITLCYSTHTFKAFNYLRKAAMALSLILVCCAAGHDWCMLQKDGTYGTGRFSLAELRQQARDELIAWGIIVVRVHDNLWVQLDSVSF